LIQTFRFSAVPGQFREDRMSGRGWVGGFEDRAAYDNEVGAGTRGV
jgi:hypothetical protein